MKKLAISLYFAIVFAVPAFAQDPCSETTKLSATASGAQSWNGTKNATTLGGSGDDAYGVEAWTEEGGSATKLTWYGQNQGGGYAFRSEWTNSTDYLGRFGYYWGNNGKKWDNLGDLCVDYNYTRSANGTGGSYSYIGVYGWTIGSSNSAEYYIVEDWFGNGQQVANNLGNNCQTHSNITVDGKTYQVVTCIRPQGSGCVSCNNQAFGQVFSIRQGMRNPEPPKCGTISIKKHFQEWIKMTTEKGTQSPVKYIYDKTYEAKFLVEAAGGTGWFDASYMKFSRTGNCGVTIPVGNFTLTATASPADGGTVTSNPNNTSYAPNSSVQVSANPATGWKFDGWSGDATGATSPATITMNANKTITAKFVPTTDGTTNLVKDGNFPGNSLTSNWSWNVGQYYGNSAGTNSINGGKVTLNITTPGADPYQPQLIQQGIALSQGMKYRLTFTASAGATRTMDVNFQQSTDPWSNYKAETFNLTNLEQQYELEFEMTEPSDQNVQLSFNVGGAGTAGTSVTISNVKLVYMATTKTLNPISMAKFQLYSLSNKILRIESQAKSVIYLYDAKGNLAQKIPVSEGSSVVKLSVPNGIYVAKYAKSGQIQTIMVK